MKLRIKCIEFYHYNELIGLTRWWHGWKGSYIRAFRYNNPRILGEKHCNTFQEATDYILDK